VSPRTPKPGSFAEEVEQFLATIAAAGSCARDLLTPAPRLGQRLRELKRSCSAAIAGSRVPASTSLRRIRTLAKTENQAAFEGYWHDPGGARLCLEETPPSCPPAPEGQ